MIDYAAIGGRIKRLRVQKHMTQEQLGECIGLSSRHVSNIETNNAHPSIEALVDIANILECSVDFLLLNNVNILQDYNYDQEVQNILRSCTIKERQIIIESMFALKKILKDNP